jgi:hypothetical protein
MVTNPCSDTEEENSSCPYTANCSNSTNMNKFEHREIAQSNSPCHIIADQSTTTPAPVSIPSIKDSSTSRVGSGLLLVCSDYHSRTMLQQEPKRRAQPGGHRVTWSPDVRCRLIKSHKSFTKEEYKASWYTAEEQHKIALQCIKEIKMMLLLDGGAALRRKSLLVHDNTLEYSPRGLEGHTPSGLLAKEKARQLLCDAVFREQERQRLAGILSDEAMAEVCHVMTRFSVARARVVGLSDQQDAKLILEYMVDNRKSTLEGEFSFHNIASHITSRRPISSWRKTQRNETIKTAPTRRKTRPFVVPSRSQSSPR